MNSVGKVLALAVCSAISLASLAFILLLFLWPREPSNRELSAERRKEIAVAIAYWSEVVDRNATWAEAYCCRGDICRRVGQYTAAIDDYTEALRLDPELVRAYCGRGYALEQTAFGLPVDMHDNPQEHDAGRPPDVAKFDKAIADYSEALRLDPKSAIAFFGRAEVYRLKDERDQAIRDYSAGIRIDPGYATAYYFRGVLYEEKGAKERAKTDFSTARRLKSGRLYRRPELRVGQSPADLFFSEPL
jgi:tetratricopeptide (TPR) repeat protein